MLDAVRLHQISSYHRDLFVVSVIRMKDPYQTLGVKKGDSADDIKNAYRKLAKKFHPDLNPGNKAAEHQFKEINSAYEILGDPKNREKFDKGEWDTGEQAGPPPGGGANRRSGPFYHQARGGGRYDFSGFDESMFEDLFGGQGFGGRRAPMHETYKMEIELRDSLLGAEREIHLPSGKRLSIKIPRGARTGQKLRFTGQGEGGVDVYVELQVKADPRFTAEGNSLVYFLGVPLEVAVLGGELPVPTPEGQVSLKIPPGSSSGRRMRIPGKGQFGKGENVRGDLMVEIRVLLPEGRDPALEAAILSWKEKREAR